MLIFFFLLHFSRVEKRWRRKFNIKSVCCSEKVEIIPTELEKKNNMWKRFECSFILRYENRFLLMIVCIQSIETFSMTPRLIPRFSIHSFADAKLNYIQCLGRRLKNRKRFKKKQTHKIWTIVVGISIHFR